MVGFRKNQLGQPHIGGISRYEGVYEIVSTLPDVPTTPNQVTLIDYFQYYQGVVVLRGLEAGTGISLDVVKADNHPNDTDPYHKIVISATGAAGNTIATENNGTPITSASSTLNFIGGVTVTDAGGGVADVTVTGTSYMFGFSEATATGGANETFVSFFTGAPIADSISVYFNGVCLDPAGYIISGLNLQLVDANNKYSAQAGDDIRANYLY
jgi:hypothetical protein